MAERIVGGPRGGNRSEGKGKARRGGPFQDYWSGNEWLLRETALVTGAVGAVSLDRVVQEEPVIRSVALAIDVAVLWRLSWGAGSGVDGELVYSAGRIQPVAVGVGDAHVAMDIDLVVVTRVILRDVRVVDEKVSWVIAIADIHDDVAAFSG
jgi:hypothetical protein